MNKQTAVEWLVEQIIRKHPIIVQFLPNYNFDKEIIEQANAMFEEQIMDAYIDRMDCTNKELVRKFMGGQYYNKTFKKTT